MFCNFLSFFSHHSASRVRLSSTRSRVVTDSSSPLMLSPPRITVSSSTAPLFTTLSSLSPRRVRLLSMRLSTTTLVAPRLPTLLAPTVASLSRRPPLAPSVLRVKILPRRRLVAPARMVATVVEPRRPTPPRPPMLRPSLSK